MEKGVYHICRLWNGFRSQFSRGRVLVAPPVVVAYGFATNNCLVANDTQTWRVRNQSAPSSMSTIGTTCAAATHITGLRVIRPDAQFGETVAAHEHRRRPDARTVAAGIARQHLRRQAEPEHAWRRDQAGSLRRCPATRATDVRPPPPAAPAPHRPAWWQGSRRTASTMAGTAAAAAARRTASADDRGRSISRSNGDRKSRPSRPAIGCPPIWFTGNGPTVTLVSPVSVRRRSATLPSRSERGSALGRSS